MQEELKKHFDQGIKDGLKVQALTQRVSELVTQYENQMAEFRAEFTMKVNDLENEVSALQQENDALRENQAKDTDGSVQEDPTADQKG